jgi:hypothetical protein
MNERSQEYKDMVKELDCETVEYERDPGLKLELITVDQAQAYMQLIGSMVVNEVNQKWWTSPYRLMIYSDINRLGAYMHYIRIHMADKRTGETANTK